MPDIYSAHLGSQVNKPTPLQLRGEIVQLVVGEDGTAYNVHRNLLCDKSVYFDKLLNGPFQDASKRSFELRDVSETTMDVVMRWLYGLIVFDREKPLNIKDVTFIYIFADKYDFPEIRQLGLVLACFLYKVGLGCSPFDWSLGPWNSKEGPNYARLSANPQESISNNELEGNSDSSFNSETETETESESESELDSGANSDSSQSAASDGSLIDSKQKTDTFIAVNRLLVILSIPLEAVAIAYEHLPSNCALIQFFIDKFTCHWSPDTMPEEERHFLDEIPAEFFINIIRCSAGFRAVGMNPIEPPLEHYQELERAGVLDSCRKRPASVSGAEEDESGASSDSSGPRLRKRARLSRSTGSQAVTTESSV